MTLLRTRGSLQRSGVEVRKGLQCLFPVVPNQLKSPVTSTGSLRMPFNSLKAYPPHIKTGWRYISKKRCTCVYQKKHKNVHHKTINNKPDLETAQMDPDSRMNKYIAVLCSLWNTIWQMKMNKLQWYITINFTNLNIKQRKLTSLLPHPEYWILSCMTRVMQGRGCENGWQDPKKGIKGTQILLTVSWTPSKSPPKSCWECPTDRSPTTDPQPPPALCTFPTHTPTL